MSNEAMYARIIRYAEGDREKRGRPRKPYLGDTKHGEFVANGTLPEPERVEVPAEFLEPQPYMTRTLGGAFIRSKALKHRRRNRSLQ